jgi:hypothetical protein
MPLPVSAVSRYPPTLTLPHKGEGNRSETVDWKRDWVVPSKTVGEPSRLSAPRSLFRYNACRRGTMSSSTKHTRK